MNVDITRDAIGQDQDGNDVFLKDIWPTTKEIADLVLQTVTREAFLSKYANVFAGDDKWREIDAGGGLTYSWPSTSTYVQNPPYFEGMSREKGTIHNVEGARILALLADSVTTDHISPAGSFKPDTPAGEYLVERQVQPRDFNSFGARRGNHEIMMRGTFANIRIKNEMLDGVEGGFSKGPDGTQMPIYTAAMAYKEAGIPLVIIAGKEYGTGSSRDWAAKGVNLLGVKAVVCETFERIHRSNLVGMGVLPLQFKDGMTRKTLNLTGHESFDVGGIDGALRPGMDVPLTIHRRDGTSEKVVLTCRIDTAEEIEYFKNGGVLHYVLRNLAQAA
jgi:aconitate hydratase